MRNILLKASVALASFSGSALAFPGSSHEAVVFAEKRARALYENPFVFNQTSLWRRYTPADGPLNKRQNGEQCGPDNGGRSCQGQRCCSFYGWCGTQEGYCSEFFCLPNYGWCTGKPIPSQSSAAPPPAQTTTVAPPPASSSAAPPPASSSAAPPPSSGGSTSSDGRCGTDFGGAVCPGQQCCSMYGWCGSGDEFCNAFGCQAEYGWCQGEPIPTTTAAPPPPPPPSTTAAPPPPSTTAAPPPSSSAASPPPAQSSSSPPPQTPPQGQLTVSQDGRCGNTTTCQGSASGACCSAYYYCGFGEAYCGTDCRKGFGLCYS